MQQLDGAVRSALSLDHRWGEEMGGMRWGAGSAPSLTVAAVVLDGGGRELDAAVARRVLRESQILQVHLGVEQVHLQICRERERGLRSSAHWTTGSGVKF